MGNESNRASGSFTDEREATAYFTTANKRLPYHDDHSCNKATPVERAQGPTSSKRQQSRACQGGMHLRLLWCVVTSLLLAFTTDKFLDMVGLFQKIKTKGVEALNRLEGEGQSQGPSYHPQPQLHAIPQQYPQYPLGGPTPYVQQGTHGMSPPNGKFHVGYFTNWSIYGRKYSPRQVPVQSLSHVLYSFADVRDDGTVFLTDSWSDVENHFDGDSWDDNGTNLYGNFKQFMLIKQQNRHLKLLLSIGGWTFSPHFKAVCSPQGRHNFVASAMKILEDVGLDGLDVDWEYPKDAAEAEHYVHLLGELRSALDQRQAAIGGKLWLSIAAPCGEQMRTLNVREMDRYLDMWNLMAYDFSGTWSGRATHHSNILPTPQTDASVDQAVGYFLSKGVAPHKLVLGMPLYARAFAKTKGLGHNFKGVPSGGAEEGNFNYRDLPLPGHTEMFDEAALACYSTSNKHGGEFFSYENPTSLDAKCDYIHRRQLGGAMWWELAGDCDAEKGGMERALVPRAAYRLGSLDQTPNNLLYPHSKYDNLRSGNL